MSIDLTDTNAEPRSPAPCWRERRKAGRPAMGMVLTFVVVTDEGDHYDAMRAARDGVARAPVADPRRHPAPARGGPGSTPRSGRRRRRPARRCCCGCPASWPSTPESVVLPLLLPDSPVVRLVAERRAGGPGGRPARRAGAAPDHRLRRDASGAARRRWSRRRGTTPPGNTDLAWTRLTPWRALLAAGARPAPGHDHGRQRRGRARPTPAPSCWRPGSADRLRCRSTGVTSTGSRASPPCGCHRRRRHRDHAPGRAARARSPSPARPTGRWR